MKPISTAAALSKTRNRVFGFAAVACLILTSFASAAGEIRTGGSGSAMGTLQLLADAFSKQAPDFRATTMPNLGGRGAVRALAKGALDLAVTSRPMNAEELTLDLAEIEYARTPFVIAVGAKSNLTSISTAQLAEIYAGKLASWPDGSPIRVVLRPATDIDFIILSGMSPEVAQALAAAQQRRGVILSATDQDAADYLEKIPGAIGPSSLALLISEKRALKALKLDGVEPTPRNIETGAYPYYKRMFLLTRAKPPESVQRFVAFIRSPAGRKILAQNGHWIP